MSNKNNFASDNYSSADQESEQTSVNDMQNE